MQPNIILTIEEQREIFEIRSRMNPIPGNFGIENYCELNCEGSLTNEHILMCPVLNDGQVPVCEFKQIYNGNLKEKHTILKKFKVNLMKREEIIGI